MWAVLRLRSRPGNVNPRSLPFLGWTCHFYGVTWAKPVMLSCAWVKGSRTHWSSLAGSSQGGPSPVCSSCCQSETISLDKTDTGGPARPCASPRAHLPYLQLCSTGSARCTHTVGLSACKRLSVLEILATSLHLSKRVLLLASLKPVQSGISSADRRLFFRSNCIPTKAFVGNFLQAHSQC